MPNRKLFSVRPIFKGLKGVLKVFLTLLFVSLGAWANDCQLMKANPLPKKIQAEAFCAEKGIKGVIDQAEMSYVDSVRKGDWLEYKVRLPEAGKFSFSLNYASRKGGEIQLAFPSQVYSLVLPKTGSDRTFATSSLTIQLPAGTHILRLSGVDGTLHIDWLSFIEDLTKQQSPLPSGAYALINENSRRSLDVQDRSKLARANIQQWEYHGAPNQSWQLLDSGSNQYEIKSVLSGLCLAVNLDDGNLIQDRCTGAINQSWAFEFLAGNIYMVKSYATSGVISVFEQAKYDGANMVVSPFQQDKSQLWRINVAR